jgi:Glycosyl hydrolase family 47
MVQTLESMFIMWRTTKDPIWREKGWAIWEAIENKTRTDSGYASVIGVDQFEPRKSDSMPT